MSSKDVGLRIRVERELREAFQGACLAENRNASEVLREFMQAFADRHQGGLQPDMFAAPAARKPRQSTRSGPQNLTAGEATDD
jgi:hypothetical protein